MARIAVAFPEHDITSDVSHNPEVLLMLAQGDDEADSSLSYWLAGQNVTQPKSSDTKGY